jgi:outer membrane cobalamin receptor
MALPKSTPDGMRALGKLKLTVPVGERWRAFVLVDNLFNLQYSVVPGYPTPGINAMGGLSLSF